MERMTSRSNRRTGITVVGGSEITHHHPLPIDDSSVITLAASCRRSFQFEQHLLALHAPAVAAQVTVRPKNAMARNRNRNRIRRASMRHRANGGRLLDCLGNFGVRARLAESNGLQIRPHASLKS